MVSMSSTQAGSWGRIEEGPHGGVLLRAVDMRELTGMARAYFLSDRSEIVSGLSEATVATKPFPLRSGVGYRVITQLCIDEEIPEGCRVELIPAPTLYDIGAALGLSNIRPGFSGVVSVVLFPFRKVEIETMYTLGEVILHLPEPKVTRRRKKVEDEDGSEE